MVRDQLKKIQTAASPYELYSDQLFPLASQTVEASRAAYEASTGGFLELITSRRSLENVESMALNRLAGVRNGNRGAGSHHRRSPMIWIVTGSTVIAEVSSLGGLYALRNIPLDAIPDLSDTQVIIYTESPGQASQIVQDQVTYPITNKMLSMPRATVVRGYTFYGFSFVYVIFAEGTDPYWACSRVLEYLSSCLGRLPTCRSAPICAAASRNSTAKARRSAVSWSCDMGQTRNRSSPT